MSTQDFYEARAAECAQEADAAGLENVRDRALRSEAAWRQMAARVQRTEAMRLSREADRAASVSA